MTCSASRQGVIERLAGDVAAATGPERVALVGEIEQLRRWLAAREAALLGVIHVKRDDLDAGARDLVQLQTQAGVPFGDARRRSLRATWFGDLPDLADAVQTGALGLSQADDLCALAERLDPAGRAELRRHAESLVLELSALTPRRARRRLQEFEASLDGDDPNERLDRQRRSTSHRARPNPDGTVDFLTRLDPISAAAVRRAVDEKVRELWRRRNGVDAHADHRVLTNDQLRAEALVELVEAGAVRPPRPGCAEVMVVIDYKSLLGDLSVDPISRLDDGTPIPVEAIRSVACDAQIIPIVLGSPSGRIDVGRATRLATPTQRVALRALHDTCCVAGCDVPFDYCEIHHVVWWRHGGPTDLANLAPVCANHHKLIHENGWSLHLDDDRVGRLATKQSGARGRRPPKRPGERRVRTPEEPPVSRAAPGPRDRMVPMRC